MTKHWTVLITASLATLLTLITLTPFARADIYEWEYINPADPGEGKQPSAMLAPDGAGANAESGTDLSHRNLTMAYLIDADLSAFIIYDEEGNEYDRVAADLTGVNLSQADLTNATLALATLTNANLSGAQVRGANFGGSGLTAAQLYSTASYQAHDLTGIGLPYLLEGANLAGQNLTNVHAHGADLIGANLSQANLTNANFGHVALTGANLSQANLTNAYLTLAVLTGANLTGAEVRGASFSPTNYYDLNSGIALAQLYSTASYQAHDLSGIRLFNANLIGSDLGGQNLTNAYLDLAYLTNANLSQANLTNAYLSGANLTGANLSQADLTNANLSVATLTNANLSGAQVRGTDFYYSRLTAAQLYSTASYQTHDLTAITLGGSDLAGVDLAGQNLTNAGLFSATLTNANFSQANLTNARLSGATLTDADLSGADARGADFYLATLSGANTSNLIQSNGHIAGLDLTAGASLVVRDYDGNPAAAPPVGPLPIVVDQHLALDAAGTLRLVFDADPWDSLISFAPGIPVSLGGTLDLTFAPGVDVATQSGRTIDLFNWTGVTPTGAFTISSPYTWNLSKLYTTGEVTLAALSALAGDYNGNGIVDAADYTVWRDRLGSPISLPNDDTPGVGSDDYDRWKENYGQFAGAGSIAVDNAAVPEPSTLVLLMLAVAGWRFRRGRAA